MPPAFDQALKLVKNVLVMLIDARSRGPIWGQTARVVASELRKAIDTEQALLARFHAGEHYCQDFELHRIRLTLNIRRRELLRALDAAGAAGRFDHFLRRAQLKEVEARLERELQAMAGTQMDWAVAWERRFEALAEH